MFRTILWGMFLLSASTAAQAAEPAEVLKAMGVIGRWSPRCEDPPSRQNPHTTYAPGLAGSVVVVPDLGAENFPNAVRPMGRIIVARQDTPDSYAIISRWRTPSAGPAATGGSEGEPRPSYRVATFKILSKTDQRLDYSAVLFADKTGVAVEDGLWRHNKQPVNSFHKCSDSGVNVANFDALLASFEDKATVEDGVGAVALAMLEPSPRNSWVGLMKFCGVDPAAAPIVRQGQFDKITYGPIHVAVDRPSIYLLNVELHCPGIDINVPLSTYRVNHATILLMMKDGRISVDPDIK